jgi:hypothetical protein
MHTNYKLRKVTDPILYITYILIRGPFLSFRRYTNYQLNKLDYIFILL